MKKTFGQLVREKRKSLCMSQADLGEQIGVSVQTISRWECDGGMPDISQIVPLAKVLGTTTDLLLGMDVSEDEMVEKAFSEVRTIWNNAKINDAVVGTRGCDYKKAVYEKLKEYVRKYPTNLRLLEACTNYGVQHLKNIVINHFFDVNEKEVHYMYVELERMINTRLSFVSELTEKASCRHLLASLYSIMGNKELAFKEAEKLTRDYKYYTQIRIAMNTGDQEERLRAAKRLFYYNAREFLYGFDHLSGAYAAMGESERENAIAIFNKFSDAADFLEDCIDAEHIYYFKIWINKCIAIQYIRAGSYDRALCYIEKMTDCCEILWNICVNESDDKDNIALYIESEAEEKSMRFSARTKDELKKYFECQLIESWGELGDKVNNPIVLSEKYSRCLERVCNLHA